MARGKQQECPPQGAPAWMVTYGDMMTLLLTFFVLIVSFSSVEQIKFRAAISSIQEGMGIWPSMSGIVPMMDIKRNDYEQQRLIVEELSEYLEERSIEDQVEVYNTPQGIRLVINDPLLFRSGSDQIRGQFSGLLSRVGQILRENEFENIRVEGHTDNVPISTARFPSNWELSQARALAVVKFFAFQESIDPGLLAAVGHGEFRPRASNDTPEGRARNRRVEIFLERDTEGEQYEL